ncbi:MAG: enoyl-CoA hydratase/isomerase family protein, partial [Pseudomonadales bacterium]
MSEGLKGSVHYETRGAIALLSIDNPPVNPLSSGVRQGLYDGVAKALEDSAVSAIVITGMHRAFIAGADISEFGGGATTSAVGLDETIKKMEASDKPIVAAINGT